MSQYQLPCENCGQVIPVTVTMAGSAVDCSHCGHRMTAPKLGAIRALAPVVGAATPVRKEVGWSTESGLLFSCGFLLLIVGGIGWAYSYYQYRAPSIEYARITAGFADGKAPDFGDLTTFENVSSKLSVEQLWQEWRDGLKANLNEWRPFKSRHLLDQMEEIMRYIVVFAIVTITGLLMTITSFFFMRKSPVQTR